MYETVCSECRKVTQVVEDRAAGDVLCAECGLVLEQRSVDETREWRWFADSSSIDRERIGGPSNPLLADGGLSSFISKSNGAQGDVMSSILRQSKLGLIPDQSRIIAFRSIGNMADRLGLVSTIKDRANEIYKNVVDLKLTRNRSHEAILASCLYIACRQEDKPRTFKEICSVSNGASKTDTGRITKKLVKQIEKGMGISMEMGTIHAGDFSRRFCSHLDMEKNEVRAITETEESFISRCSCNIYDFTAKRKRQEGIKRYIKGCWSE
nr:transcription initiation factor IIB-like isoform X2 [Physcomitrium patens]|eukprot:XP_024394175.1 transcription initiation factor IIB-like isoform X2 [Physcomitrella patens]